MGNVLEQLDKAIEILDELIEENLTQEERDRRDWKFAGVQFVESEVENGQADSRNT